MKLKRFFGKELFYVKRHWLILFMDQQCLIF